MTDGLDYSIRPASPEDDVAIVQLLCATLGWADDERHRALFRWKHRFNPFGESFGWVAEDELGLIGSRTFMRWTFSDDGRPVHAVRAVDTATHPRAQGRGVFRALTMRGVEEMTAAGVSWVFNTPNSQSAPGYLSMGWRSLGRLPLAVRPGRISSWPKLLSARRPGDLWSVPTSAGEDAAAVLNDALLPDGPTPSGRLCTFRSAAYLRWRYGQGPIAYRVALVGRQAQEGCVVFRHRRRGDAVEAVVTDILGPPQATRNALRSLKGADYTIALGPSRPRWWVPVPGKGPLLTCRPLADARPPEVREWDLSAGDIELF